MPLQRGGIVGTVTTSVSNTLTVRPEEQSAAYASTAALSANTAVTIFTAASNTNGAILFNADIACFDPNNMLQAFITKATAPTSITDGSILLLGRPIAAYSTSNQYSGGRLESAQYIAAGLGLYFISHLALAAGAPNMRACRYKLL